MKLGLFNPIDDQMVTKLTDASVIHGPAHVHVRDPCRPFRVQWGMGG